MRKQKVFIGFMLVALVSSAITYFVMKSKTEVKPQPNSLMTVNSSQESDEPGNLSQYLSFRIKYPSNYLVTSDDMVTSYKTQGGGAPPRLILAKKQLLNGNYYEEIKKMDQNNEDCILIWETRYFTLDRDWRSNMQFYARSVTQLSEEKLNNNKLDIIMHRIKVDDQEKFDAFLQLPRDISYYFQTCSDKNEQDFRTVLENFDLRGNE